MGTGVSRKRIATRILMSLSVRARTPFRTLGNAPHHLALGRASYTDIHMTATISKLISPVICMSVHSL